jgi:tetratricopeptide (TPR) repeat protein
MAWKPSHWSRSLVLFVCAVLAACSPSGPAEQLIALAEALFRKALALNRRHQASYVRLGNLYVKQHRFAAALDVLQRAMRLNPRDPTTLFNLGLAYEGLGQERHAVAAFTQAITLNPAYASAHQHARCSRHF